MVNKYKFALTPLAAILFSCSVQASQYHEAEAFSMYEPVGDAVNIVSRINDPEGLRYINAKYWLNDNDDLSLGFDRVDQIVKDEGGRYLIDFTEIFDYSDKIKAKKLFSRIFGISFDADYVAITKYKESLLFTELTGSGDQNVTILNRTYEPMALALMSDDPYQPLVPKQIPVPNVAFYVNASRQISDQDCKIEWNTFDGKESRDMCQDANISLIYKVNMQRSLAFGSIGDSTPDAKLVRVAIDDSTTGGGISLNKNLRGLYLTSHGISWPNGGNEAEWTTTAIARDYTFDFTASNRKARVLRTIPSNNLNANYDNKETSSFQFGISGTLEANKDGAKGNFGASAVWKQEKHLTFKTFDYGVTKANRNEQNVSFKWEREQYPTAYSILNNPVYGYTAPNGIPAYLNKINPIGYANFTPKMEVIYSANPEETGATKVNINSSVGITGFRYYSWIRPFISLRHFYSKDEDNQVKRVGKNVSFTINWEHPVFTGARPVNLQLASFNNRCIELNANDTVKTRRCESSKHSQAFIFDADNRYVSATDSNLCLDGMDVTKLETCSANLSQTWEWVSNKRFLRNKFTKEVLGYKLSNGELTNIPVGTDMDNLKVLDLGAEYQSRYVDVFRDK
ncbi:hypothetical protein A3K86_15600 [Photobacterium jeanii]|uniref:Ricin B lectin domain-containing protein n=1 Tax=Photobacterium jeanii TaxID=858640 RepID=A0A178K7H8_9GAMM|nr:leukocidin family pore-forming toxin [Photobacterium jeanii]OAN13087.1 hypothetical protein A3K86_15600 [Photobacterium jeanii]PST89237.1 hypothetical protein C9I91_14045 [Photobacterium jeanii]